MNTQLPLISYLTYQPKQFYFMPSFTFQVFSPTSTAIVVICEKGPAFVTEFTAGEVAEIEEIASRVHRLPQ